MYITGKIIKEELDEIWPGCFSFCTDTKFLVPKHNEFKEMGKEVKQEILARLKVNNVPSSFIDKIFECEDITKAFIGVMILQRVEKVVGAGKPQKYWYSWPYGICFGRSFFAQYGAHFQVIVRCEEGWRLYEPQTEQIWTPSYPDDDVLFNFI